MNVDTKIEWEDLSPRTSEEKVLSATISNAMSGASSSTFTLPLIDVIFHMGLLFRDLDDIAQRNPLKLGEFWLWSGYRRGYVYEYEPYVLENSISFLKVSPLDLSSYIDLYQIGDIISIEEIRELGDFQDMYIPSDAIGLKVVAKEVYGANVPPEYQSRRNMRGFSYFWELYSNYNIIRHPVVYGMRWVTPSFSE